MRDRTGRRTLIVGAGRTGRSLMRELRETAGERVVGFVDDNPRLRRRRVHGAPVLGAHARDRRASLERTTPDIVLVTIPDAPRERLDTSSRPATSAGVACRFVRREIDLDPRVVLGAPPSERTSRRLDRMLAAIPVAVARVDRARALLLARPRVAEDADDLQRRARVDAALARDRRDRPRARRSASPQPFKSLYAYVIAPAWWIDSVGTAYAAIKYLDTLLMCLDRRADLPARTHARAQARSRSSQRSRPILTSAMFYATFLLPEALAYPVFAVVAYLCVRSLAGGGRRWTIAAIRRLPRRDRRCAESWRRSPAPMPSRPSSSGRDGTDEHDACGPAGASLDHVGAGVLVARRARRPQPDRERPHRPSTRWSRRRRSTACGASASRRAPRSRSGIGVLPAMSGLASLWLPRRRDDPAWRAFAAFTAAAVVTVIGLHGVKAAYLSTVFATRVEERNMIYLGPLLIVGCAVYFTSRRHLAARDRRRSRVRRPGSSRRTATSSTTRTSRRRATASR